MCWIWSIDGDMGGLEFSWPGTSLASTPKSKLIFASHCAFY
ncbi:MAG: hypothetical protein ACI9SC_002514 [Gammaproteobacteria bacterium]